MSARHAAALLGAAAFALAGAGCNGKEAKRLEQVDAELVQRRDRLAAMAEHRDEYQKEAAAREKEVARDYPTDGPKSLVLLEKTLPGTSLGYQSATRTISASGRGGGAAAAAAIGAAAGALPGLDLVSLEVTPAGDWSAKLELKLPIPPQPDPLTAELPPEGLYEPSASKNRRAKIEKERREVRELERLVGPEIIDAFSGPTGDAWQYSHDALPHTASALRNATAEVDFLLAGPAPILHDGTLTFSEAPIRASGTTALDPAALASRVKGHYEIAEVAGSKTTLTRSSR